MKIIISENAATMLDAMHAGCTVSISSHEDGLVATLKPGQARHLRAQRGYRADQDGAAAAPLASRDMMLEVADNLRVERIDAWKGEPGDMPFEDAIMLVRGGLATRQHSLLTITDQGRAIAQARIGDGLRIVDGAAEPVSVEPDTAFRIGDPPSFELHQRAESLPIVRLSARHQHVVIACEGPEVKVEATVDKPVMRTLAGFLADVGKVRSEVSATFGRVAITLTVRDETILTFQDPNTTARATMPKPLAKVLRAYLLELAKGGTTEATLEPVEVEIRSLNIVDPDSLRDMWSDFDPYGEDAKA